MISNASALNANERRLTSCPADAYDTSSPVKRQPTAPLPLTHPPHPARIGRADADAHRLAAPSPIHRQIHRRLGGGWDKGAAFAPQGRAADGAAASSASSTTTTATTTRRPRSVKVSCKFPKMLMSRIASITLSLIGSAGRAQKVIK